MSAPTDVTLLEEVTEDLLAARIGWVEARQRRATRDSHANRIAEAAAWDDVWAAFELWDDVARGDCE